MTGTSITLSAMKRLPFGLPKLLISSVAAMPAYAKKLAERKLLIQDTLRVQARTSPEEMKTIAKAVFEKLNGHKNKKLVKFVIPIKGFSSISVEGGVIYDPISNQAFIDELKKDLDSEIHSIEVATHINTPEFARAVINALE